MMGIDKVKPEYLYSKSLDIDAEIENKEIAECNICEKKFKTLGLLKHHIATVHEGKSQEINCEKCLCKFTI